MDISCLDGLALTEKFDRICFSFGDETALYIRQVNGSTLEIAFAELQQWSLDLAGQLQSRFAVNSSSNVLIYIQDGNCAGAQVVAMLACLRLGCKWVAADTQQKDDPGLLKLAYIVENSNPTVAITVGSNDSATSVLTLFSVGLCKTVLLNENGSLVEQEAIMSGTVFSPVDKESSVAYIQYTSGSTGISKGVMGTALGIKNRLSWQYKQLPFSRKFGSDLCCKRTPIIFIDAVAETLAPLLHGVPLWASADESDRVDIVSLARKAADAGVTRMQMLPSQLNTMMEFGPLKPWKGLKTVVVSGEPVTGQLVSTFRKWNSDSNCGLVSLYGSTEVAGDACFIDLVKWKPGTLTHCLNGKNFAKMPIGRPIANTSVFIHPISDKNSVTKADVLGEICVSGHPLSLGYWNHGSKGGFVEKSNTTPRYYRTGDLGYFDSKDELFYWVGRIDNQKKVRGIRIEMEQVEDHIMSAMDSHTKVVAIVFDSKLIAFFERDKHNTQNPVEIRRFLQSRVLREYLPHRVIVLDKIKLTQTGKVDRTGMMEVFKDMVSKELSSNPNRMLKTDEISSAVSIIMKTLQSDTVYSDVSFLAQGGDSMLAIRLAYLLERELNCSIAAADFLSEKPIGTVLQSKNIDLNGAKVAGETKINISPRENKRLKRSNKNACICWQHEMKMCVDAAAVISRGFAYVGSHGKDLVKLSLLNGEVKWRTEVTGRVQSRVELNSQQDLLFVCTFNASDVHGNAASEHKGTLLSICTESGKITSVLHFDSEVKAAPLFSPGENCVFVGSYEGTLKVSSCDMATSSTSTLYKIGVNGSKLGEILLMRQLQGSISSVSAGTKDRPVIVTTLAGKLYCFSNSCCELWSQQVAPIFGAPIKAMVNKETIIGLGAVDCNFYCFKVCDGSLLWKFNSDGPIFGSGFVMGDKVLVGGNDKFARLINLENGNLVWKTKLNSIVASAPTTVQAHTAVFATVGGTIYWIDCDSGMIKYQTVVNGEVFSSPISVDESLGSADTLVHSCDVVVGCRDNKLYRLQPHS